MSDENKKRSVAALVATMAPEENLAEHFDGLMRTTTDLSNDPTIRNHEVEKVDITSDADLIGLYAAKRGTRPLIGVARIVSQSTP